MKRHGNIEQR